MKIAVKDATMAPERGMALIYFRTHVYYGAYTLEGDSIDIPEEDRDDHILELHLFDQEKEYREIYSEARKGYITVGVSDTDQEYDRIVTEECRLLPKYGIGTIKVVSYMKYNEQDMLYLTNYRLCMVG